MVLNLRSCCKKRIRVEKSFVSSSLAYEFIGVFFYFEELKIKRAISF